MVKKAVRNKPFTKMETRCDTIIRKTRFKIARTYEGIKGWFKGSIARYSG
jgi:IS5 family transposase